MSFIVNNLATIVISIILLAIVAAIITGLVRDKKKGKSSCGCNCSNCPHAANCHNS